MIRLQITQVCEMIFQPCGSTVASLQSHPQVLCGAVACGWTGIDKPEGLLGLQLAVLTSEALADSPVALHGWRLGGVWLAKILAILLHPGVTSAHQVGQYMLSTSQPSSTLPTVGGVRSPHHPGQGPSLPHRSPGFIIAIVSFDDDGTWSLSTAGSSLTVRLLVP